MPRKGKAIAAHSTGARWEVGRLRADIEELYVRADPRGFSESEVAADLGRYLCVRVSGFLEQATAVILREFCKKNSWGELQQFAHSWLDQMPNMSSVALIKLVRRFSNAWGDELEAYLSTEERKSGLNSLVGIRNDVAHGKNQGVSREQAWSYYTLVVEIIDWLLDRFDANPPPEAKS
jgi:hypothetical protein